MDVTFCPLFSGSSGNSIFISTKSTKILIDAGVSGKKIENALTEINVSAKDLDAIFITHEHKDHITGAGILSRRFDIPLFATCGTWEYLDDNIGKISPNNKNFIYNQENCFINDICVLPFEIPHDANEPVGFNVFAGNTKITIATDFGYPTDLIKQSIFNSDILLLEANHDVNMLENGSYPYPLKQRILSDKGHISNITAGNLIKEVMNKKLKYIYLGHLSEENNDPSVAYATVLDILKTGSVKEGFNLFMAERFANSVVVAI